MTPEDAETIQWVAMRAGVILNRLESAEVVPERCALVIAR
jgi:hypothetical protein